MRILIQTWQTILDGPYAAKQLCVRETLAEALASNGDVVNVMAAESAADLHWQSYDLVVLYEESPTHLRDAVALALAKYLGLTACVYDDTYYQPLDYEVSRARKRPQYDICFVLDRAIATDWPCKAIENSAIVELPVWSAINRTDQLLVFKHRSEAVDCVYIGWRKSDRHSLRDEYKSCEFLSAMSRGAMAVVYTNSATCLLLNSTSHYGKATPRVYESLHSTLCAMPVRSELGQGFSSEHFDLFPDSQLLKLLRVQSNCELKQIIRMAKEDSSFRSWAMNIQAQWARAICDADEIKLREAMRTCAW